MKNIFEAITATLSQKNEDETLHQVNEDDLVKVSDYDLANAFTTMMVNLYGGERVKPASIKRISPKQIEFFLEIPGGLLGALYEKMSVRVNLEEAYATDGSGVATLAMFNFDYKWTHTTGGRNGLLVRNMGFFSIDSRGMLNHLKSYRTDSEASRDLRKYGFA